MMNIAIFASGSGTNAENISKYFSKSTNINVKLILTNKKDAFVLQRAENLNIKSAFLNKEQLSDSTTLIKLLDENKIEFIVLAGYLKLIPEFLIEAFPNKIINIHPALLPKFGGKGMYGMNVHRSVVENNETETGITVHYVHAKYDDGNIISQFKCLIEKTDSAEDVAAKIHILEMENFPKTIEKILTK